jgi:DNA-binding LacI/PurR family transcriptional regulator
MHDALFAKKYQSLIACSFGRSDSMLAAIELFETYSVDGIVLDISEGIITPEIEERVYRLQRHSCSVVVTGGQRHDISCDHLYLDNQNAIAKIMRHLVSRGHRTFGFLGGFAQNLNIKHRLDGFKAALRKANISIEPEWISLGDPNLSSVAQRAYQLLQAPKRRPTAIVTTSDMIAMVVLKVAAEAGLRVPADLALTGFDDIEQAGLLNPGLTTVRQPLRAMAADIVDFLLKRNQPTKGKVQEKRYEAELVIREST